MNEDAVKTYVLYHADCYDGFAAAFAFWKKFKDQAEYIAVYHDCPLPEMEDNSMVYIVDFSYSKEVLLDLFKKHRRLVLIDHHISAQKELDGLEFATFDMEKSGAVLAFEYLFSTQKIPTLIKYVQDRDLWHFKLKYSKAIQAYISTVPYNFDDWQKLEQDLEGDLEKFVQIGEAIVRGEYLLVKSICHYARIVDFDGHKVPACNTPILNSNVGHELLDLYPQANFSVSWFMGQEGDIKISLRSRGDFDVSTLAGKFGGGGHKSAAGCRLSKLPW
ncbi:MAG: hypothetical protein ISR65_10795 [Bacteriovoracaceae bacterium]|nr:hypothetical protein [Bacteriovoracaceae bacterium]